MFSSHLKVHLRMHYLPTIHLFDKPRLRNWYEWFLCGIRDSHAVWWKQISYHCINNTANGFISAQLHHPRPFIQHHITLIWKVSCEKMRKSTQDWQHCTLTLHPLKCTLLLYLSLTANYTVSLVSGFISTWRRIWKIDVSSQIDPPLILITKKNLRQ